MFRTVPQNATEKVIQKWKELGPIHLNDLHFTKSLKRKDLKFGRSADSIYLYGQVDSSKRVQGVGRTVFASGNIHEGQYVNDKREGYGRFIWSDGAYYEGYWANGMRNGEGKFVHACGEIEEGFWVDGEMKVEKEGSPGAQRASGKDLQYIDNDSELPTEIMENSRDGFPGYKDERGNVLFSSGVSRV